MKKAAKILIPVLALFLSYWAISPFFRPGFFPVHDDTQVARVFEMAQALRDGQFPVRWVSDLGYGFGYPIFNFYSPWPYYFGAIFVILGFDALVATKIMFLVGILLAGLFMYLLGREFWGEAGGLVSGLFLIYAPYHAVQIYVRGAVAELWALAFIPLAVLSFYRVAIKPRWWWIVVGSVAYAAIMLSHNITAMVFSLFLLMSIIPYLFVARKIPTTYYLLLTTFFGLALSAFFWLPALWEAKFVDVGSLIVGTNDFHLHFLCPWQLWNSPWGFGGSALGCIDGMSFKVGKLHILLAAVAFLLAIWRWKKDKSKSIIIVLTTFYLLLSTFMMLEISKSLWEIMQPLAFVQYPWRFLGFVILGASFLSGAFLYVINNKFLKFCVTCFVLSVLLLYNSKYFQPQSNLNVTADYYTNKEALTWRTSKISDEYLPKEFSRPQKEQEVTFAVNNWSKENLEYNFKVNTPVRTLANLISLITLLLILGVSIHSGRKRGPRL